MNRWKIEQLKHEGGFRSICDGIPDDLFLVCASYESRTITVAECFADDYRAKRGIIYVNREFLENRSKDKMQSNINRLQEILTHRCNIVDLINGSWLDPKEQFISLRNALVSIDPESLPELTTITLDVTTFNREALLTAMLLVRTHYPKARIRIMYVSPINHGEWLSRGFRFVRNVMGFPGIQQPTRSTVLVGLSGFEPERMLKIIEEYEPTKVLLGIGDPPTSEKFLKRNLKEQKLILAKQDIEEFRFPADNIKGCWECLEGILTSYIAEHNVILAPMSTKLSTIAALLVAEHNPEIQIAYCVPGEYNIDDYSTGTDSLFIDEIPYDS